MVVATERVARRKINVVADVPISIDFPAFEATDVYMYYGNASLVAVQNVDYTVTLDEENFNTFEVTPTASLIAKIDALILADPTETNFIVVRRIMDFLTVASDGSVRDLRFLAREFDRTAMRLQQVREELERAIKLAPRFVDQNPQIDELVEDTTLLYKGGKIVAGPTSDAVSAAQQYALDAQAAKLAAETARDVAIDKENSMLRDRGAWATAILYSPSDIFTEGGRSYITQTAHFATNIAADLSANHIRIFADKGASGAGSGDMNNEDNLSGLTDKPLAFATIGGKAVGKVDLLPFSLVDPLMAITHTETLAANKTVVDAFPTARAVAEYVDPQFAAVASDWELGWHPFDMVTPDDGNDGLIYDQAVDGTVALIEPDDEWVDGYEYRFRYERLSPTTATPTLQLQLYRATEAVWSPGRDISPALSAGSQQVSGIVTVYDPSAPLVGHLVEWLSHRVEAVFSGNGSHGVLGFAYNAQKIRKGRLLWSNGFNDLGTVWMDKRRVRR